MIAFDTNILVAAHRSDAPAHDSAFEAVRKASEGRARWAIPWPCIHEFLAIVTHPRIFRPPTPLDVAIDQVEAWLESPTLAVLGEGPDHLATLAALLRSGKVIGPVVHDARVAALCLEHGVAELWTADRDFGRFPGLRTHNPLVDPRTR